MTISADGEMQFSNMQGSAMLDRDDTTTSSSSSSDSNKRSRIDATCTSSELDDHRIDANDARQESQIEVEVMNIDGTIEATDNSYSNGNSIDQL